MMAPGIRPGKLSGELHESNPIYSGVKLSRNKGHQNALLAGLMTAKEKADMAISLDADLQDDVDVIDKMVEKYYEGVNAAVDVLLLVVSRRP